MRKFTTLYFLFAMFCTGILAQETVSLNVSYTFDYVRDLESPNEIYADTMMLSLAKKSSRYSTLESYNQSSRAAQRKRQEQMQSSGGGQPTMVVSGGPGVSVNNTGVLIKDEILKDFGDKELLHISRLGPKTYSLSEQLPKIDWQIKAEKKNVLGYSCQQAVGEFQGRTYTAWFTTALPFPNGPWKLSGLPGLILEARDAANEVAFIAQEITKNTDPEETTSSFINPDRYISVKPKKYEKLLLAFLKDPLAVYDAAYPGVQVYVDNVDDSGNQEIKKIEEYNPLEK